MQKSNLETVSSASRPGLLSPVAPKAFPDSRSATFLLPEKLFAGGNKKSETSPARSRSLVFPGVSAGLKSSLQADTGCPPTRTPTTSHCERSEATRRYISVIYTLSERYDTEISQRDCSRTGWLRQVWSDLLIIWEYHPAKP